MENNWLRGNITPLTQIKRFLTECEYLPEFDDFPLRPLQKLLNGAEAEIKRLQIQNDKLTAEMKILNTPCETPQSEISDENRQ